MRRRSIRPAGRNIEGEIGEEKMEKEYDLLIIGAGPGGYVAAQEAAKRGMSVLVIDKTDIGGTCVNRGCIPAKALIHASTLYRSIQECEKFGLYTKEVGFDFKKLYQYKDETVAEMRKMIAKEFEELGVAFVKGEAAIQADKRVRVVSEGGEQKLFEAKRILIATGAQARHLGIPGADLPGVVTSEELLTDNERHYDRLLIVGGGIIGLEIATMFQALGTEVTVIELGERLLPTMDIEFAEAIESILLQRGIHIYKEALMEKIEKDGDGQLISQFVTGDERRKVVTDGVLVSVGRDAYTEGLFDRDLKIKLDRGRVVVNEFFMTNISGIYAVGDVIGGIQLAHVASAQAKYVVERMNNAEPSVILSMVPSCLFVSTSIIPNCLYMNPEIASVGFTEEEARRKGVPVRCGKYTMAANGQTIISKEEVGFIKVLFAADSDVLLGAQIMCQRATDMIGELATAIANGLTSRQLMYAMRAYPTFNEAISKAVESSRGGRKDSESNVNRYF